MPQANVKLSGIEITKNQEVMRFKIEFKVWFVRVSFGIVLF